jgi:predicted transcriptional regulator
MKLPLEKMIMSDQPDQDLSAVEMTAQIVSAYVSSNSLSWHDLPALIKSVHGGLLGLSSSEPVVEQGNLKPAVPIKKSIFQDHIICLEDGKAFKSLKRHLQAHYGLTPEQYRQKWGLPDDYPMVAPDYTQKRSMLAKKMGLGRKSAS